MFLTLLLWLVLGWFLGVLIYLTAGFMTMPLDRPASQHKAASYYTKIAQKLIGRSALMERGTKFDIVSTSHDAGKNADTFNLDGDEVHAINDIGLLSHLHKKPFGLLAPPEDSIASYVSPELAEFGEVEARRREQYTIVDEEGQYVQRVTLSGQRPLVKLRGYIDAIIPGSMGLHDISETEEIYKQSQAGFADSKTVQFMILIIGYAVGAGVTWLILTNAGGAAPTNVDIPSLMVYPGWVL